MGFYSPSQLIQDAVATASRCYPSMSTNRTGTTSYWTTSGAAAAAPAPGPATGQGPESAGAQRLVEARQQRPFRQISNLRQRAQLDKRDMEALADADALQSLSGHRHQSQWQIMALEQPRPLLQDEQSNTPAISMTGYSCRTGRGRRSAVRLPRHRAHPAGPPHEPAARRYPFNRCKRHTDLAALGNNRFVRIAGLVTCRQRPGSASGVLFLTLEDETGNSNIVVWQRTQQQFRQALMGGKLLLVKGMVEQKDNVIHIIAGALYDYTSELAELPVQSHDFH